MAEPIPMENVCIWGSVQSYVDVNFNVLELLERLASSKDAASNNKIEFSEATNRSPFTYHQLYIKAKELDLVSRCRLNQPGAIIMICLPPGINALVACLAGVVSGGIIIPVSYEDVDNHDLNRIISLSKVDVLISTRKRLLDCEYSLVSNGAIGASFGGEGPLMVGAIDLTTKVDPKTPRISLKLDFKKKDDSFMYFYDEKTKLLWDVTHRAASAIIQSCIRPSDMYWHEKVLSKVNGLAWLSEILPRLLAIPLEVPGSIDDHELSKTIIVFDLLYQSRVRRRPLRRRAGPRRIVDGESSVSSPELNNSDSNDSNSMSLNKAEEESVSDLVELYLLAGQYRIGNVKQETCLGIRKGSTCQVQTICSKPSQQDNYNKGKLSVFGPTTMRRVIGNPTMSVESFFLDGDFRLWMDLNQAVEVEVTTGRIHHPLSKNTSVMGADVAVERTRRNNNIPLSERPIRRPIRLPPHDSSSSSKVLESNEQSTSNLVNDETNNSNLSTSKL